MCRLIWNKIYSLPYTLLFMSECNIFLDATCIYINLSHICIDDHNRILRLLCNVMMHIFLCRLVCSSGLEVEQNLYLVWEYYDIVEYVVVINCDMVWEYPSSCTQVCLREIAQKSTTLGIVKWCFNYCFQLNVMQL